MEAGQHRHHVDDLASSTQTLDTVRALHQTVVALRGALDKARTELQTLRTKVESQVDPELYSDTIQRLSLENHVLRQHVLNLNISAGNICLPTLSKSPMDDSEGTSEKHFKHMLAQEKTSEIAADDDKSHEAKESSVFNPKAESTDLKSGTNLEHSLSLETRQSDLKMQKPVLEVSFSDEVMDVNTSDKVSLQAPTNTESSTEFEKSETKVNLKQRESSMQSLSEEGTPRESRTTGESDNESEELDDIELIFTTEETKELGVLQEDLVSITETENWQETRKSDVGKDEKSLSVQTEVLTNSVVVETDISKCGVVDENEMIGALSRRNTLPTPLVYQPIIHREALSTQRSPRPFAVKFISSSVCPQNGRSEIRKTPVRPILSEKNSDKRESEAQTDITALPSHWRSESYLAHKVSHNFTTLPSKFALPVQQPINSRYLLKLSDKTQEARRTLLSDINFTSMVPELSRSADHLCQAELGSNLCKNYPRAFSYMKNFDGSSTLMSPGYRQFSPCDCYPRYRGSLTSITMQEFQEPTKRRHSWRPSSEGSWGHKPSWGSMPSSPTHTRGAFSPSYTPTRSDFGENWNSSRDFRSPKAQPVKMKSRSRVTFQESSLTSVQHPGYSLPDLRSDDSGDSTDSLIDEAEECLRRSIDSMLTGKDWMRTGRLRQRRRLSEPDPIRDFVPPKYARPFLPKIPRDLHLDHLVKVISQEGRVLVGRVRYVGPVPQATEPYVGVELPQEFGDSDGAFRGRRFFDCLSGKGIFVPFKKVIMAWSI